MKFQGVALSGCPIPPSGVLNKPPVFFSPFVPLGFAALSPCLSSNGAWRLGNFFALFFRRFFCDSSSVLLLACLGHIPFLPLGTRGDIAFKLRRQGYFARRSTTPAHRFFSSSVVFWRLSLLWLYLSNTSTHTAIRVHLHGFPPCS